MCTTSINTNCYCYYYDYCYYSTTIEATTTTIVNISTSINLLAYYGRYSPQFIPLNFLCWANSSLLCTETVGEIKKKPAKHKSCSDNHEKGRKNPALPALLVNRLL